MNCECEKQHLLDGKYDVRYDVVYAARLGHVECVRKFCAELAGYSFVTKQERDDICGEALVQASGRGCTKTMEVLIQLGSDVNFTLCTLEYGDYGEVTVQKTPLIEASKKGHTEAIELLLNSGANINQAALVHYEDWGNIYKGPSAKSSAIIITSIYEHRKIVELLLSRVADRLDEVLCATVEKGDLGMVETLLQYGASPNSLLHTSYWVHGHGHGVEYKSPVLMQAVCMGHFEISKLLLENGAHVDYAIQGTFSWIPFPMRTSICRSAPGKDSRWLKIIKLLLMYDVDVRQNESRGPEDERERRITAFCLAKYAFEEAIMSLDKRRKEIVKQCILVLNAAGADYIFEPIERSYSDQIGKASYLSTLEPLMKQILRQNSEQISLINFW